MGEIRLGILLWSQATDWPAFGEGLPFTGDLPLTGTGTIDDTAGAFRLNVTTPGGTRLTYRRDAAGTTSVSGTFRPPR